MALIYVFLNINISNTKIKILIEKLGKCSLTIYMLHIPLLAIYNIIYNLWGRFCHRGGIFFGWGVGQILP